MKKIYSKKSGSKLEEHLEEFLSNVHDGVLAFDDYDRYSDDEIRRKKVRILCDKESLKPIAAEAEGILEDLAVIGRKMRSADGVKPDFDEREDEIIMHYVFFESIPPEDLIPPELEEKLDTIVFIEEIEKELIRGEEVAADEMLGDVQEYFIDHRRKKSARSQPPRVATRCGYARRSLSIQRVPDPACKKVL